MNPLASPADAPVGERALWQPADPNSGTWSELLCADPLIIQTMPSTGLPVGSAGVIGPLVRDREAHFLLTLSWTIEPPHDSCTWINAAKSYLVDHRLHRLTFLTNTERERQIMSEAGFDAITLNHNCLLDDAAFHPLPDIEPICDAVYNARLSPQKRPQLAVEIERLAFIYYYGSFEFTVPQFHNEHARLRAMMPDANFVNKLTPEGCEWLPPQRVNEVLAQSRVGLCLSAAEGAMRASIEYLFAGLSVVSTPSLGGRDHYFDDEYCIIADPNPRSIREAVEVLITRAVPREYVRAKTLARVEVDRARYIAFVQGLIDRARGSAQFADRFRSLIHGQGILPWRSMSEFASAVVATLESNSPAKLTSGISAAGIRPEALWRPADPNAASWSQLICADPIIVHAMPSIGFPLGSASVIGPRIRDRPAYFLIMPASTMEAPRDAQRLINIARSYLHDHSNHHVIFLGNTEREQQLMADAGFEAITLNQNCLLDDAAFHPLPNIEPIYDAVSNARLSPEKRLQLAVDIERLALVYFYDYFVTVPQFHNEHARLRAMMPDANFVNKLTPEGCEWLPPQRVNEVLAQSRVGLCLSAAEGAMRASIEYLFAGLSVVSTPSLGGRDHYFDDEYCIVADPNPRSIREAVEVLITRAVPREYVRAKTLARVEVDRARYIAFVQGLIDRARGSAQFADRFRSLIHGQGILPWRSMSEFASAVVLEVDA